MKHYEHSETGWVMIVSMSAGVAVCAASLLLLKTQAGAWGPVIVSVVMLAVLAVMYKMDTYADEGGVGFRMGIGLVRKYIPYSEISSAAVTRSGLMAGWGIHYVGGGWVYNVNSQDAVEVRFKKGGRYLIGTNDPQGLCGAVLPRIKG
jgi:hypothetical protein